MSIVLKLLTLFLGLVLAVGLAAGCSTSAAKADAGVKTTLIQKAPLTHAPAAKTEADEDDNEADDDDDDGAKGQKAEGSKKHEEKAEEAEDGDEIEVVVTLDQVPPAVRDAILAKAGANKIEKIEAETEKSQTTYEAKWTVGGKEVELKLTADGKVVEKKAKHDKDGEDDEDDGDQ
jgi:hypothetical protein